MVDVAAPARWFLIHFDSDVADLTMYVPPIRTHLIAGGFPAVVTYQPTRPTSKIVNIVQTPQHAQWTPNFWDRSFLELHIALNLRFQFM